MYAFVNILELEASVVLVSTLNVVLGDKSIWR